MRDHPRTPVGVLFMVAAAVAMLLSGVGGAAAQEARITHDVRVPMSDGVELQVRVGGRGVDGTLPPRPVVVEFSPYGPACCPETFGPAYNEVKVHLRGTGSSDGAFDSLGPRAQADVVEVLRWVCEQPWSDGRTGLVGFSASAIIVYNSLHRRLPCVETAVLGSGTHELYRDLLYPGGIPNGVPALGVFGLIGAPLVQAGPARLARAPLSAVDVADGMSRAAMDYQLHPTLDSYWRQRGFRGDVNDLPILMVDGFFDVESRGAFQAFQDLRDDGAHLLVVGAHDGVPAGLDEPAVSQRRWMDHHLRGIDTGVDDDPPVRLYMADGDREDLLDGAFVRRDGGDWPLPGTRWETLHLTGANSGTSSSLNDGSLSPHPGAPTTRSYPAVVSPGTATDPYTTSILGVFNGTPLTDMATAEPLGLAWTTEPLARDVWSAGPASLEVVLSSTSTETDLYAVISDVWPDGTAHPMAAGRLRSTYPEVDKEQSLTTRDGRIVRPYSRFEEKSTTTPGVELRYHVEIWPIGNRFREGHRIRLHLVGASSYHQPTTPAVNSVRLGPGGSRLHLPVLPGSSLRRALGSQGAGR